jgi:hypothetical protein
MPTATSAKPDIFPQTRNHMLPKSAPLSDLFSGTVESHLERGKALYTAIGAQLMQDHSLVQAFDILREHATSLGRHMAMMEMSKSCFLCSSESSAGGCCSLAMAGEVDTIQLLMNMLSGVTVGIVRDDGRECCFLGDAGCIFLFKPIFCLNYNCRKIITSALPDDLKKLERLTGKLLVKQYEIEGMLLARIGSMS